MAMINTEGNCVTFRVVQVTYLPYEATPKPYCGHFISFSNISLLHH